MSNYLNAYKQLSLFKFILKIALWNVLFSSEILYSVYGIQMKA